MVFFTAKERSVKIHPYRYNSYENERRPNVFVRLWYSFVGKLVYGGEPTCGHCCYWTEPEEKEEYFRGEKILCKGDCKLLYGEEDTLPTDTCRRFTPARRYMHREKVKI